MSFGQQFEAKLKTSARILNPFCFIISEDNRLVGIVKAESMASLNKEALEFVSSRPYLYLLL